jgi:hypothetical protein
VAGEQRLRKIFPLRLSSLPPTSSPYEEVRKCRGSPQQHHMRTSVYNF